jgi:hypothetical protein
MKIRLLVLELLHATGGHAEEKDVSIVTSLLTRLKVNTQV